jgi:putative transposase
MMTYYHRRLPHWLPPGQDVFITWRLHGSLPGKIPPPAKNSSPGQAFAHYDHFLDNTQAGPLWLKDPRIAECVLEAMIEVQKKQMGQVRAYTLMTNHVHILLTPLVALDKITHQIKGATARRANLILSRTGAPFWQDESFDHWVRSPAEHDKIRKYIERNPVVAGLAARPEDWPWSSVSRPICI